MISAHKTFEDATVLNRCIRNHAEGIKAQKVDGCDALLKQYFNGASN